MRKVMDRLLHGVVLAGITAAMLMYGCSTTNNETSQNGPPKDGGSLTHAGPKTRQGLEARPRTPQKPQPKPRSEPCEDTGRLALAKSDSSGGKARKESRDSKLCYDRDKGYADEAAPMPAVAGNEEKAERETSDFRAYADASEGYRPAGKAKRRMLVPADEPAREDCDTYSRYGRPARTQGCYDRRPVYFGRDRFEHNELNPVRLAAEEPVSTFSVDVDTASYAFVRKSINSGHLPQRDAVRVEEMINYFDYDYRLPKDAQRPFMPNVAVYPTPWNLDTKLVHIGIKGLEIDRFEKPRANLVFLIDVSGSMNSRNKLPLVQKSMRLLLDNLEPDDTVGIVVYAGAAGTVLEPTKACNKRRILGAIKRLRAGGSTAGAEGIRQAYALAEANYEDCAVNRVILATDGDFNVGITNQEELKGFVARKRNKGIFLTVLGFGTGNYNDALMQTLAQNGNGNAAYIDTLDEAKKVLVDEAGSTLFTIAKDVKIQVEFNPERVAEYRLIGYENRMLKREDFNNDKVDAGDVGCGHTVTAIYEITPRDSRARFIDDLRYSHEPERTRGRCGEYAFLRIRYKLPFEDVSRLIELPITDDLSYRRIKDVPEDMRFAAAVAAFGQMLRGAPYTGDFSMDDVARLAGRSRGWDPNGHRREFMRLVRAAKCSPEMASLPYAFR